MLRQIKRGFLRRNARLLRRWDESAYEACLAATSLPEMLAAHAPFAMRQRGATGAEYLAAHDPMEDRHGVVVPTLVLNAEDDFVCPAALARPEVIVDEQPGCLLLVTRSGSHVAFNEGRSLRRSPFHLRVSLDFLEAARATADAGSRSIADRHAWAAAARSPPSFKRSGAWPLVCTKMAQATGKATAQKASSVST